MTLAELARRLYAARRAGVKLDLSRVRELLDALGQPGRDVPAVLIGGTNGKGSTVAFAASIARAAGVRVGAFTSPHLSRLAERFAIDGEAISDERLVDAGARVEAAVELMTGELPTFFERVTAMAMVVFDQAAVELMLLEVGLGGRFDSTNAIEPAVSVVTGVALDHQDYLGDSLEEIAREKAGIFRTRRPALIGCAGLEPGRALLRARAEAIGAEPITMVQATAAGADRYPVLGLAGAHQRGNAACALALVDQLGLASALETRRAGLASARLPGRLERLAEGVRCDGAHNPHAAAALAAELGDEVVLVVGVSSGKDLAGIAAALAPRARAVVATRSRNPRAVEPQTIARAFAALRPDLPVCCADDIESALIEARAIGPEVVVCGSLFVVGEAREAYGLAAADIVELADPV